MRADRSIEERVALAMPVAIIRAGMRACMWLAPGSPFRQRILERAFARGLEGSARGDHSFALLFYEPDVDLRVVGEVAPALGLAERYAGQGGLVQAWHDYTRDMGTRQVVPEELIDLGDRVALRAKLVGVGRSCGVETARTPKRAIRNGIKPWPHSLAAPRPLQSKAEASALVYTSSCASNSRPGCIHSA